MKTPPGCTSAATTTSAASQLMKNTEVANHIAALHRQADATLINTLRDFRAPAPVAQSRVYSIKSGFLPGAGGDPKVLLRAMCTKGDASITRAMLEAAMFCAGLY